MLNFYGLGFSRDFLTELMHSKTAQFHDHSEILLHSHPDYFYITLYAGDTAQVCQSEGEEFSCPTAEASFNATFDRTRCPLQGPPMAPVMESQLLTG